MKFCDRCGNRKEDHKQPWSRCWGYVPRRYTCRVCGGNFDPARSGRDDCCYRHRMDS